MKSAIKHVAFSIAFCLAIPALLAQTENSKIVSLPEATEKLKKHTPEEDEEFVSSSRPAKSVELRRASNLIAAEHYEEAISDFAKFHDKWNVPTVFKNGVYSEWGFACEKLGRLDEALSNYKIAGDKCNQAEVLIKQGKYGEAKTIADGAILDCKVMEAKYKEYEYEYKEWLRIRAAAEEGLKDYKAAVADLTDAAKRYFKYDGKKSQMCVKEVNQLIAQNDLGEALVLKTDSLPVEGSQKVLNLIDHLIHSDEPFKLSKINSITGSHLQIPNKDWTSNSEDDEVGTPFKKILYQSDIHNIKDPQILEADIESSKCSLPKSRLLPLIPADAEKTAAIDHWNGSDCSPGTLAWNLSKGCLQLTFGEEGSQLLYQITFLPLETKKSSEESEDDCWRRARSLDDKELEKKVELFSKLIQMDNRLVTYYLERSKALTKLKRYDEALKDAKTMVEIAGRPYLVEQSVVEEAMDKIDDAIEHQRAFIGDHKPGPETSEYFCRLGELYLKKKNFELALDAAQKAMIETDEKALAYFVKAKAEAGLNRNSDAKADSDTSIKLYFDQARIVLRDRVIDWQNTLPKEQE